MNQKFIQDIIKWDVESWSKALYYWEENVDWSLIGNGLELGGHSGGLSLWLASKGKNVVCSDLKDVQKSASELHLQYDFKSNIQYEDIDATNIPYENHFDIIVFKSIIGGIGRNDNFEIQKKVFLQIHKALKPGGKLLFAENLVASPLHRFFRKYFVNWGNSWRYMSLHEMHICLEKYSSHSIKTNGVLASFGRNENQRNILSKLDNILLNKIVPANWKYIVYGIAEK